MTIVDGTAFAVLLVEDDPGDVLITREALSGSAVEHDIHVVGDGEQAIAFLHQEGEHTDAPRPDLILLDLNLPRLDGREVLQIVKEDDSLRRIPVVVLTTSKSEEDISRSYDLHANAYVVKPSDVGDFQGVVREIDHFFSDVAAPPAG